MLGIISVMSGFFLMFDVIFDDYVNCVFFFFVGYFGIFGILEVCKNWCFLYKLGCLNCIMNCRILECFLLCWRLICVIKFCVFVLFQIVMCYVVLWYGVKLSFIFMILLNWIGCLGVVNNYEFFLFNRKVLFDIVVMCIISVYVIFLGLVIMVFLLDQSWNGGENVLYVLCFF